MALSAGEDEDEDDEDGAGIRNRPMGGGSFRRQQQQQHHRRGGGGALLASLPGGGGGSRPWKSATNDSDTDPAADPDANFFRLENLRGGGSSSEDERPGYGATWSGAGGISVSSSLGAGVGVRKTTILDDTGAVTVATSADGRERMEWQSMLASVLGGEILKGEKSRIGGERPTNETYKREIGDALWWQIRARLRGRSEEEERRRTAERRRRVVDSILEELETFKIEIPDDVKEAGLSPSGLDNNDERQIDGTSDDPEERAAELREAEAEMSAEDYAIEKILITLGKLSLAESLYPHEQAMRAEKPLYDSRDFQARVDAMSAWSTLVRMLHSSLVRLQRWTGSKELDVTQRNTTSERPLQRSSSMAALPVAPIAPSGANGAAAADDSTFIERILKEDSITKIFGKRAMIDLYSVMYMARETVIEHHQMFDKLGLSRFSKGFRGNLVMLCAFPARLIIEALRVRLDAVTKLVDPSVYAIDDMIDNFRQTLHLACQVKERYLQIIEPDESGHWAMPSCVGAEYDAVILDGLRTFFKLLHWKLKSGSKAIYFKETEVLEDEWEFLYTVAEAVEGGDVVVAEHFCSLTNKLMVRVINYFETQLRVPVMRGELQQQHEAAAATAAAPSLPGSRRAMNTDEMLQWFAKILDAVKMRYRKLQRFARRLTQRFDNSAEYAYSPSDIDLIIEALDETDHFLVYTQAYEAEGTYIIADPALRDRPDRIQRILASSFSALTGGGSATAGAASGGGDDSSGEDDPSAMASYLLVFTPRQKFVWPGAMLHLELPFIQLRMGDNRCRLVADGPASRLATCKDAFSQSFLEQDVPFVQLDCIVEQQAHLPQIQRELKKISRSTNRLSECIVESVTHVRAALKGAPGAQELVENWFAFAADHGQRVSTHMDHAAWSRFSRLLMRLAINWVGFVCDQCDPTDRKTFRWAVNALEYAMTMTRGNNILHMEQADFALLRSKVAACMALLISHFDILGARSSIEAKKEADKLEAIRRLQRIQENQDDELRSRPASPQANEDIQARIRKLTADVYGSAATDRSIRLTREARMSMIAELEAARAPPAAVGHVLDETVGEDRSLLFLASSSSNIALRWQQGGFIGGGANGNVYIGFNLDSGGIMAVKEIRVQDLSNSPALYKQIKDESDVMQMLSHPNIVDYYGIEVHRDRVYIFEEYCEGGSLANLLENGRIEDEEIIQVYTIQMLQGLEYLHSKGVEHRDVKPDSEYIMNRHIRAATDALLVRHSTGRQFDDQIRRLWRSQGHRQGQSDHGQDTRVQCCRRWR